MKIARIVALAAAVLLGRTATAQEFADLNKPITLDLGLMPFVTSLEPIGNWPLTIRMLANKPLGIGTERGQAFPPYLGSGVGRAWIVWSDPDGVFSFGCDPSMLPSGKTCPATDETFLEFTPGLPAKGGTAAPPSKVNTWDWANKVGNTTNTPKSVGPAAGYGASPAVPGLVILRLDAALYFFNANTARTQILNAIARSPLPPRGVLLDVAATVDMDVTTTDMLDELASELHKKNIEILLAEARGPVRDTLRRTGTMRAIGEEHVYLSVAAAVADFERRQASAPSPEKNSADESASPAEATPTPSEQVPPAKEEDGS